MQTKLYTHKVLTSDHDISSLSSTGCTLKFQVLEVRGVDCQPRFQQQQ